MKRWGLGLVVSLLALMFTSCGGTSPRLHVPGNPDDLDDIYDSVVALVRVENGRMNGPYCTASFVGPRTLATAAHCVQRPNTITLAPGITIPLPGASEEDPVGHEVQFVTTRQYSEWRREADEENNHPQFMSATVVVVDDENDHDVALLELTDGQPSSEHWLEMRDLQREPLRVGEEVYSLGMPVGQIWILTDGIISRVHIRMNGGIDILHQVRTGPGSSGAPIMDHQGRLIGIHSGAWGSRRGTVLGEAKPVSYIKTMIRIRESQREIEELDRRFEETRQRNVS